MVLDPEEGHCPCLESEEGTPQGYPKAWEPREHQSRAQPQAKAPLQPHTGEKEGSDLHCGTQLSAQPFLGISLPMLRLIITAFHIAQAGLEILFGLLRIRTRKPQQVSRVPLKAALWHPKE